MRKQQGLSLVELMIAIALGIVLMAGVIQVFISSKTVFSTQQGMSRIQESGRLAMEILAKDIRMAGYRGCIPRDVEITSMLNDSNNLKYNMAIGIEGFAEAPPGVLLNPEPLADTDVILVRTATANTTTVSRHDNDTEIVLTNMGGEVEGACPDDESSFNDICKEDILLISDCAKAIVFQASDVQGDDDEITIAHGAGGTPGNLRTNWGGPTAPPREQFGPGAEILKTQYSIYYIGISPVTDQPALFQFSSGANASFELLEGVENVRFTYSLRTTPENFQAATAVPAVAWNMLSDDPVVAVRIEMLVRSTEDGVLAESQPYTFAGVDIDSDDRRMRQVFINTIGVRGRLP